MKNDFLEKVGEEEWKFIHSIRNKKLVRQIINKEIDLFPKSFNFDSHRLEWGWLENRPFLRVCHLIGLDLFNKGHIIEAIKHFKQMLIWNPNDNQGIRELLADIYVKEKNWEEMLSLAKIYPSDVNPSVGYGEAIALYKTGSIQKATKKLKACLKYLPLCAKILLEDNPKKPNLEVPGYVIFGGEGQAYEFWEYQGEAWKDKEIQEWIKSNV